MDRELRRMKFQAAMHGADVGGETTGETKPKSPASYSKEDSILFQDPSAYEHMTQEERQELTERMMGIHRQAMRNAPLGR